MIDSPAEGQSFVKLRGRQGVIALMQHRPACANQAIGQLEQVAQTSADRQRLLEELRRFEVVTFFGGDITQALERTGYATPIAKLSADRQALCVVATTRSVIALPEGKPPGTRIGPGQ